MYAPLAVIMAILFFILSPDILFCLPPGCDKYTTAAFHSIVFAITYMLIEKPVVKLIKQTIPQGIKKAI